VAAAEEEEDAGNELKEGRKEHLKGMQASLAQLKEQLKSGDKANPRAKRETRTVRKDK
jgi:ribosomal protein L29